MISLPIGFFMLVGILFFALENVALATLINPESIVLVIFGCLGVLAMSAPVTQLVNLFKELMGLIKPAQSGKKIDLALMGLAKNKKEKAASLHPLIVYSQELWQAGVDHDLYIVLMAHRLEDIKKVTEGAVATIKNLSKFPPAMGMTGTVIGLVSLFSHLTPDNKGSLGPSLALAMTSTLYGLVAANMVLLPLADRLFVCHLEKSKIAEKVYGTLLLIHQGEPEDVIKAELDAEAA